MLPLEESTQISQIKTATAMNSKTNLIPLIHKRCHGKESSLG